MAKLNKTVRSQKVYTHEGGRAVRGTYEEQLRRSVMCCLLWEDTFYEDGMSIAERIAYLVPKVKPEIVRDIAVEARKVMGLRHVPLLIAAEMSKHDSHKPFVAETIYEVCDRADQITEFMAIYWRDGKHPIAKQVKIGLARAFKRFNEYQLAKYDRDGIVKLRDVMFLVRPKPDTDEQAELFKKVANRMLATPDTWEVQISAAGKDVEAKKNAWDRLLRENKLGALALIRNLRNMIEIGIDIDTIVNKLLEADVSKIFPYQLVMAGLSVEEGFSGEKEDIEQILDAIDKLFVKSAGNIEKLPGKTAILIDVSGSMVYRIADNSKATRIDVAAALGAVLKEVCEKYSFWLFDGELHDEPQIRGLRGYRLVKLLRRLATGGSTYMWQSIAQLMKKDEFDRLIVITDEQTSDDKSVVEKLPEHCYIMDVASYKYGVSTTEGIVRIDGFSAGVVRYIYAAEQGFVLSDEPQEEV